ncbi:MAG TPA: glycosyltransferase [bacterium]|jgi:glycosyltransferase involved in cell wall biosynthesis|nr:glycosyltransferase [bacterium]
MKPRRVLYVDYYSSIAGGQVVLLNTFKALDRSRYTPILALPHDGPMVEEARRAGVPVYLVPMKKARWRRPWEAIPATLALAGLIRSQGVELVEANCYPANKLAGPAAWLAGVPCLWHKHILARRKGSTTALLWRLYARLNRKVLGASEAVVASLRAMGIPQAKLVRIYNGIDIALVAKAKPLSPAQRRAAGFPPAPVVGVVAVHRTHKGLDIFLRACKIVAAQHPKARFVIVGDPAHAEEGMEASIQALAADPALRGRVRLFPGQREVLPWMRSFDILVSPSRWEVGAPLVPMEAMSLGVPVVATDRSSGELIRDGKDGLLVPSEDPEALAYAILRLLKEPALAKRLAAQARRTVRERHSLGRYAGDLMAVYDEVLAPSNAGA